MTQGHLLVLISDYVLDLDAVKLTTVATVFLFILSRTTIIMLCTKLFLNNDPWQMSIQYCLIARYFNENTMNNEQQWYLIWGVRRELVIKFCPPIAGTIPPGAGCRPPNTRTILALSYSSTQSMPHCSRLHGRRLCRYCMQLHELHNLRYNTSIWPMRVLSYYYSKENHP